MWLPTSQPEGETDRLYVYGYLPGENCPWEGFWYGYLKYLDRLSKYHPGKITRWFHLIYVDPRIQTPEEWEKRADWGFGRFVGWERDPIKALEALGAKGV